MNYFYWVLFALVFWLGGYRSINVTKDNFMFPFIGNFIHPPKWLFFLCGQPRSHQLPYGVISGNALTLQILGILLAVYGIAMDKRWPIKDPNLSAYIGMSGCILLSFVLSYILYKVYPYISK